MQKICRLDKIGLDFGMPSLNSLLGQMMPGDLIVLGGATSAGKTSLGQKIALAMTQKSSALIFSLEMDSPEFTNQYLAQRSRISTEQIETGNLVLDEYELLLAWAFSWATTWLDGSTTKVW